MKQTILYIGVGILLLVSIASHAWFYTSFRTRIGNTKFFLLTFIELLVYADILVMIDLDWPSSIKLLIIALTMSGNLLGSIYLYRKEGKVQQDNQGDG